VKVLFDDAAWEDYLYWQATEKKTVRRIHELIKDAGRNPFAGIGKPEPLRYAFSGYWSRRITEEHRMVYKVENGNLLISQLRYHY
jgi:toxin YoeB